MARQNMLRKQSKTFSDIVRLPSPLKYVEIFIYIIKTKGEAVKVDFVLEAG
jgi:hypothetical protein